MSLVKIVFCFILFIPGFTFAQTDTVKSIYPKLDTMINYKVSLASGPAIDCNHYDFKRPVKYYVDCKEVSKAVYDKYNDANKQIGDCKPCYLEMLDKDGTLLSAAVQYTDCMVGAYTEYYPDGKIKVIGHYRENDWERGYCGSKEGSWIYYDENGNVTKTEIYKDNQLVH